MENFNYPVSKIGCEDKIMHTRRQLDEVMDMMRSNIEKLSVRSEKLEDLACRAEVLDMSTNEFQRCAGEVRRQKMWKAYAVKAIAIGALGVTVISTIGLLEPCHKGIAKELLKPCRKRIAEGLLEAISLCESD